jgi:hypothetical protein
MSLMHPYAVTDRDGVRHATTLADCLNIQRTPAARDRILDRTFHRFSTADGDFQVEKAMFYLDLARGQAFLVQPPRERYRHADASAALARMLTVLPAAMRAQAQHVRLVFGLEELREKLVAADAGLDDRAVELMKAALVHDHPVLMTRARLRLSLDRVDAQGARFLAQYDHSPKAFTLTYATPELFCHDEKALRAWSGTMQRHDLYKLPAHDGQWVNYRRWLPSQDAVAQLHEIVGLLAKGKPPQPAGKEFQAVLKRLPRGSALSGQGKQDLRKLFLWAKKKNLQKLEDQLFELRFGIALEDSWYRNSDKDDIDTIWQLLKNLPDSHVEGNARLAEINLGSGGGGTYSASSNEIEIGSSELAFKERFEDTLRHEVGHAVHESHTDLVNGWLWDRFGWVSFEPTAAGIDDWVKLMGTGSGWPGLTATQKTQMRSLIRQACGPSGEWGPKVTPVAPTGSPWKGASFGPRLAFEKTGENWFGNNTNWFRANGKAFAYNFWYGTLMSVSEATLDFVNKRLPDNYAAMSPAEFFAEVYALYFDLDDPKRKNVPADVAKWIDKNLGGPEPTTAPRPASTIGQAARPGKVPARGAKRPFRRR